LIQHLTTISLNANLPYPELLKLPGISHLFARIVTERSLFEATIFFLIVTAILVSVTYIYLYIDKKKFFFERKISQSLEVWITQAILSEESEQFDIPDDFKRLLQLPAARSFVMKELVNTKKSLTGAAADNIDILYATLGLKKDSIAKLHSRRWYEKAKGIQELYVMNQNDALISIYRNTNNKNELVRMEAQIGIIHLAGFKGLRFLNILTYPIPDWQQIKLLDQLSQVKFENMKQLPSWLQSSNEYVVLFALRLAETYLQLHLHKQVAACLQHANERVRTQAIRTLIAIADDNETATTLTQHYQQETDSKVRSYLLNVLTPVVTSAELPFLSGILNQTDLAAKIQAARLLASNDEGLHLLEQKAAAEPDPYKDILLHVQSESTI